MQPLGIVLALGARPKADEIAAIIASDLCQPGVLTLSNARSYLDPLLLRFPDESQCAYLAAPKDIVRRLYQVELFKLREQVVRYGEMRLSTPINDQVAGILPSDELFPLGLFGSLCRTHSKLKTEFLKRTRDLREELIPWKCLAYYDWIEDEKDEEHYRDGEFPEGTDAIYSWDFRWMAAICVATPILSVALPWRWYYSLPGAVVALGLLWMLHRWVYTRARRRFNLRYPRLKADFVAIKDDFRLKWETIVGLLQECEGSEVRLQHSIDSFLAKRDITEKSSGDPN